MLGEHQDFVDEAGLVLHLQQAGRQAAKNSEVTNLGHDSMYGTGLHLGLSSLGLGLGLWLGLGLVEIFLVSVQTKRFVFGEGTL